MSEQFKEMADIPRDFLKDGSMFLNRCTKRQSFFFFSLSLFPILHLDLLLGPFSEKREREIWTRRPSIGTCFLTQVLFYRCVCAADKREFIKISQAVGVGFVIMGTIGYFVKLSASSLSSSSLITPHGRAPPHVGEYAHADTALCSSKSSHTGQQHIGRRSMTDVVDPFDFPYGFASRELSVRSICRQDGVRKTVH